MQQELGAAPIHLHGVNSAGSESGNAIACDGKDIPWLQDTVDEHVWTQWQVTYRDVIVLDDNNVPVAVYNLTDNDLAVPANYAELKSILQRYVP